MNKGLIAAVLFALAAGSTFGFMVLARHSPDASGPGIDRNQQPVTATHDNAAMSPSAQVVSGDRRAVLPTTEQPTTVAVPAPDTNHQRAAGLDRFLGDSPMDGVRSKPIAVCPQTPEQRESFIFEAINPAELMLPELCADLAEQERAKLGADLSAELRLRAESLIEDVQSAELGYRIELADAIRQEVRSADLSLPQAIPKGKVGLAGAISASLSDASLWGPGSQVVVANYFLDFQNYSRVQSANENLRKLRRELDNLLGR